MAGVVGAHHTSFTVSNLNRSLEFFRDLLGMEVLANREIRADYFDQIVGLPKCQVKAAMLRIPGSDHRLELFEYVQPRGHSQRLQPNDPGSTHLSLLVDNLKELHQELQSLGITFVSPPVPIAAGPNRGGSAVYLYDPNGILIELFQPPAPEAS
jgi:catechol 2,3-dioxygenase-like lactoylglutathione lyase family enzyme